jgi:hypothetical protein
MEDLATELEKKVAELATGLGKKVAASRHRAWINYFLAYFLYIAAVLASIIATLSVAFDLGKIFTAILAAAPGAALSVNSTFQFEARSSWHYKRMGSYERLVRGLKFEGREAKDVSEEITHVEEELAKGWPGFRDPIQPKQEPKQSP